MANGKKQLMLKIEDFINSDKKCMFITGTHQFHKHLLTIAMLEHLSPGSHILFRSGGMQNLTDEYSLGKFIDKQPRIGEKYRIGSSIYESDTIYNSGSWHKTSLNFDYAIVYPIDSIAREGKKYLKCIDNLFEFKQVEKIFLISWIDSKYDYSIFDKYVDVSGVYDAEEEDLAYHKRVLERIEELNS